MASAWLEVNLEDGNPKPLCLPLEWALYPGGWRCKLASLNLGRLPEWTDDEEEEPDATSTAGIEPAARVRSTTRHDYEPAELPEMLAGLIRAEAPLPEDWDVRSRPHYEWREPADPQELSTPLSEFELEDDVTDDEELDRALVAETKNDQGPNAHQVRANRLIGQQAVVETGVLAGELVRVISWPGISDDHVRVQVNRGAIYSIAMDNLDIVDKESAQLLESLRSAARQDPFRVPEHSFAHRLGEAVAKDVLPPEEVPEEVQPKEPVTIEPDLPDTAPGPLPDQEVDPEHEAELLMADQEWTYNHIALPDPDVLETWEQPVTRVDDGSPFGMVVPGSVDKVHHPLEPDRATLREQADHELVKPTEAEVAEQAAKGTKKLKAEAAALKRWKKNELPGYVQLVKQGYDPKTSVHFRSLTPEQREELSRAVR